MTYPRTKCFWMEFADLCEYGLRRYTTSQAGDAPPCPRTGGRFGPYHSAVVVLGHHPAARRLDAQDRPVYAVNLAESTIPWPADDDDRWPTHCECGFEFREHDGRQHALTMLYRRTDTGELLSRRHPPPGAMFDADWYPWKGPDGRSLVAICPNGHEWTIDARASNCTLPNDDEHRCWVRHGEPPEITVDKNGLTCAAGAGSIQAGDYHGFLRDGWFTEG